MDQRRIQYRIGTLILGLAIVGFVLVLVDRVLFKHRSFLELLTDISILEISISIILFSFLTFWNSQFARQAMAVSVFLLSAPSLLVSGSESYYGMGILIAGILLLHRFGLLVTYLRTKLTFIVTWAIALIWFSDRLKPQVTIPNSVSVIAFIIVNLAVLYFLFEEEIRDLMAANRSKDAKLAEQAAEIARLEPLSVLGERVAHVAHSFKNNLSLVGTALFYLEMNDTEKAVKKIQDFSKTMNERIDNILMVSRAGAEQGAEVFDAARMLAGLNQVYLTEPAFLQRAKVELDAPEATPVFAARWDFLLMAENILKNALEALTTKGGYGNIRISLKDRLFTIANDGGAMALCSDCSGNCLTCHRYGKPGQTTKAGGTGHGLAQVFATCRKYGWTLRIKTHENWTSFEIGLTKATVSPLDPKVIDEPSTLPL